MKQEILTYLIEKNDYVSGEELRESFHVTRAAVWKAIDSLRKMGYEIEAKKAVGYRIKNHEDRYSVVGMKHLLKDLPLFKGLCFYETIDSTNEAAKRASGQENWVYIAREQTAGKGRMGRRWSSGKDRGIYLSMKLHPKLGPDKLSMMTQLTAVALHRSLKAFGIKSKIKWPNDMVIKDAKLAGILTELVMEMNEVERLIIGVGINVKPVIEVLEEGRKAASLKDLMTTDINKATLVKYFLQEFSALYQAFLEYQDLSFVVEELNQSSAVIGKRLTASSMPDQVLIGKEITPQGNLVVTSEAGQVELFFGEISVRGLDSYI